MTQPILRNTWSILRPSLVNYNKRYHLGYHLGYHEVYLIEDIHA